jgi:hypothetical protein
MGLDSMIRKFERNEPNKRKNKSIRKQKRKKFLNR